LYRHADCRTMLASTIQPETNKEIDVDPRPDRG
jgi:hypothetical protein